MSFAFVLQNHRINNLYHLFLFSFILFVFSKGFSLKRIAKRGFEPLALWLWNICSPFWAILLFTPKKNSNSESFWLCFIHFFFAFTMQGKVFFSVSFLKLFFQKKNFVLFLYRKTRQAGLEPTTIASVVQYSIQLSYSRWKNSPRRIWTCGFLVNSQTL